MQGVGILRLNETCKGYATRDVLIPGKTHKLTYIDYIPNSKLVKNNNWTNLVTMEAKHVISDKMSDLNEVSDGHDYLQFLSSYTTHHKDVSNRIDTLDSVIYISFSIGGCGFLFFLIKFITKLVQHYKARRGMERCVSVVFHNVEHTPTTPPNSPKLSKRTAPYVDNEEEQAMALYPKLKTSY